MPSLDPTRSLRKRLRRRRSIRRERLKASRDRELHPGAPPKKQIVVCGYPRSGTSLLYNMLSSSLEGFTFGEFESRALNSIWMYGNHATKRPRDVADLPRLVEENIHGKQIFAIVLIRDIRDVITSIHPQIPDRYYCGYEDRWTPRGEYPYRIVHTGDGVRSIDAAIERAKGVQGIELAFVRYEELVEDPDAVQERLAKLLDVQFSERLSEFHRFPGRHAYKYEGDRRPSDPDLVREGQEIDRSRKGRWRREEHRRRIQAEFGAHPELFELLKRYGYEKDDGWYDAYRSEERDASESADVRAPLDSSSDRLLRRVRLRRDESPTHPCVMILGMHRSGTSSLAGMLRSCGLYLGEDVDERNTHNVRGNQENRVVRRINKRLLEANGGSWYEPVEIETVPLGLRRKIRRFKTATGARGTWGIKDPRMLFCLPAWREPRSRTVGIFRHPLAVARSLEARNRSRSHPVAFHQWEELWFQYNRKLLDLYEQEAFPIVNFDWEADRYRSAVGSIARSLSLDPRGEGFFDPSLRHQDEAGVIANELHADLYQQLLAVAEIEERKLRGE
jgi:hypothetical protein